MQAVLNCQLELNFRSSCLKAGREYFEEHEKISTLLEENPGIVNLVYKRLKNRA